MTPERALAEALKVLWAGEYDIGYSYGAWRAFRLDSPADLLTAGTAADLNMLICADKRSRASG